MANKGKGKGGRGEVIFITPGPPPMTAGGHGTQGIREVVRKIIPKKVELQIDRLEHRVDGYKQKLEEAPTKAALYGTGTLIATSMALDSIEKRRNDPDSWVGKNADYIEKGALAASAALLLYGLNEDNLDYVVTALTSAAAIMGAQVARANMPKVSLSLPAPQQKPGVKGTEGDDTEGRRRDMVRARRAALAQRVAGQMAVEDTGITEGIDSLEAQLEGLLEGFERQLDQKETGLVPIPAIKAVMNLLAKMQKPEAQAAMVQEAQAAPADATQGTPGLDTYLMLNGYEVDSAGYVVNDETGLRLRRDEKKVLARKERRGDKRVAKAQVKVDKVESKDIVKSGELAQILAQLRADITELKRGQGISPVRDAAPAAPYQPQFIPMFMPEIEEGDDQVSEGYSVV